MFTWLAAYWWRCWTRCGRLEAAPIFVVNLQPALEANFGGIAKQLVLAHWLGTGVGDHREGNVTADVKAKVSEGREFLHG